LVVAICLVALLQPVPAGADEAGPVPPESSRRIGVIGLRLGLAPGPLDGEDNVACGYAARRTPDIDSMRDAGLRLRPLFSLPTAARDFPAGIARPDLERWLLFELPDGREMGEALAWLRSLSAVETAYALPRALPASVGAKAVPDFKPQQGYLGPAPEGLDAEYLWDQPGGRGNGVVIADVEGDWNRNHYDLGRATRSAINGEPLGGIWYNHGTAVLGELAATRNNAGVTGIAFRAKVRMFSIGRVGGDGKTYTNVPDAINRAAAALGPGDVIVLEVQYSGLQHSSAYIPVEYYEADFEAIRSAAERGIAVVEAAGNGSQNLDAAIYGGRFDRAQRDSLAILVGAGAPPGSYYADRSRLSFSNFGSRMDVQGWGSGVTTTGYGHLYRKGGENYYFTNAFNGTSSATGMLGGAVACLQGFAREAGLLLKPRVLRRILTRTGSPQQGRTSRAIGPRPDLRRVAKAILKMAGKRAGS